MVEAVESKSSEKKLSLLGRLESRFAVWQKKWPPLAHATRAGLRYTDRKADLFAAGVSYYSVLSLFPVIMVSFAVLGQVLAQNPNLLDQIKNRIMNVAHGGFALQINQIVDAAIASRGTVGIIGLAVGLWSGLGWMSALRESLTQLWRQEEEEEANWFVTKFSDLGALVSFGCALIVVFALATVSKSEWLIAILARSGLGDFAGAQGIVLIFSTLLSLLAAWVLIVFVIARLPRKSVALRDAAGAGLLGAVFFQIFIELGYLLLKGVTVGPAGKAFGPILGIMVFFNFTVRIILFSTAWAATHEGAATRSARLEAESKARMDAATEWIAETLGISDSGAEERKKTPHVVYAKGEYLDIDEDSREEIGSSKHVAVDNGHVVVVEKDADHVAEHRDVEEKSPQRSTQ